jgi:threonine synthase
MYYISTRGQAPQLDFESAVLTGLASDGGLYLPAEVPSFSTAQIAAMQELSYTDLAFEVMWPFTGGMVPEADFRQMITDAYQPFRHQAIAPMKQLGTDEWVLELFHGPTLAFKDFALQFLGHLVDYFLKRRDERVVVLGATSGDTGSAAMAGCQGRERMQSFILFPHGRISEVQRRQMTTIPDANIHAVALDGTFDDCQHIVKSLFADAAFRQQHHLVAVNSINWARILAQAKAVSFSVPTGNFGDIFAGYIARQMGLPIKQLIIATNSNDILTRCLKGGDYTITGVTPTISPSMDIQISSNFERLLFDLYDRDAAQIAQLMQDFKDNKTITLDAQVYRKLTSLFSAERVDDAQTKATIKAVYEATGELLDPHTAIGVKAGRECQSGKEPLVCLATAHPAKFPDAVEDACGVTPVLPEHLADLFTREERCLRTVNDVEAIKTLIAEHKK